MHVSTPSPTSDTSVTSKPIRDLFDSMRAEQGKLSEFIEQTFDELHTLRTSLDEYQHDLDSQHAEAARARQELDEANRGEAEHVESLETELAAAQAELEQLRLHSAEELATNDKAARHEIDELRGKHDAIQGEFDLACARIVKLEQATEELAQMRASRDEAQDQRDHTEGVLHHVRTELDEALREVDSQHDEIAEFIQQRDVLETELESVRVRACELSDSLDQTKRQMADEQARLSIELKKMRQLLDHQMEQTASPRPAAASRVADVPPEAVAAVAGQSAPPPEAMVVGSVMAQFDNIRRQRAQRRAKRPKDSA